MSHELQLTDLFLIDDLTTPALAAGPVDITTWRSPAAAFAGITTDGTSFFLPAGHSYSVKAYIQHATNTAAHYALVNPANVIIVDGNGSNIQAVHPDYLSAVVIGPATVKVRKITGVASVMSASCNIEISSLD